MSVVAFPGMIWSQDYTYQPRWPWGQDGTLKVYAFAAAESLLPGTLVQVVPGTNTIRTARDTVGLAGVVTYDPQRFDHLVVYQQYDMVPVVRRGSVFCSFITLLPPFANPAPMAPARFYPGLGKGQFTNDVVGTLVSPGMHFSMATKDYYQNSDGSPQADVPFPVPAVPLGETVTTFGTGCALLEFELG